MAIALLVAGGLFASDHWTQIKSRLAVIPPTPAAAPSPSPSALPAISPDPELFALTGHAVDLLAAGNSKDFQALLSTRALANAGTASQLSKYLATLTDFFLNMRGQTPDAKVIAGTDHDGNQGQEIYRAIVGRDGKTRQYAFLVVREDGVAKVGNLVLDVTYAQVHGQ